MTKQGQLSRSVATDETPAAAPSLGPMSDRLGMNLRLAQKVVFQEIAQGFAPFGITPLLFSMLALIDATHRCRQIQLGAALAVKQPNLVQRLDELVSRGLVERVQDPDDRRANVLTLTDEGQALLRQLEEVDRAVSRTFVEKLGVHEHDHLIQLLKRLSAA